MIGLKQIFTWWNRNTLGTFLKTLFFGKLVGKDELGNKYYKNKKMKDGSFMPMILRLQKSPQIGFFGCIIP